MQRILGLDLGVNSVGWALVETDGKAQGAVVAAGVRVFEAGMEGDISAGRGESRAAKRRSARQMRRQLDRRRRRRQRMVHLLQRAGLLPPGEADDIFPDVDRRLFERHKDIAGVPPDRLAHTVPYYLRARALDARLEPDELARVLYHLVQRRGFNSNRRGGGEDDKEKGEVKKAIGELRKEMEAAGARTLGEYYASLDPRERRIRKRWTDRKMYFDEFNAIMDAQAKHHPGIITPEFRAQADKIIFYQRPLKSAANLVGWCELEENRRRAPWALLDAQSFRLIQMVDSTRIQTLDGTERKLTPEERELLIEALETGGDLTVAKAKTTLGLKSKEVRFNWEEGGEKRFVGNRTRAKIAPLFGDKWDALTKEERDQVVEDLRTFQKKEPLIKRARGKWGLSPEDAEKFGELELEDGYCSHSRQAIAKLLPLMRGGKDYATAKKELYGDVLSRAETGDMLPPVDDAMPYLRNPTVHRVLTEVRKVVNAVVARHGKPDLVRIELARDIRTSKKRRQEATKKNRANELKRKGAKEVLKEIGIHNPSRDDILRVLLFDECNKECPYTGRPISMSRLFGPAPEFDIEHIVPFSRCFDDSYMNKTLCYHEENRNVKRNQTPFEAYSHDPENWETILQRVGNFQGDAAKVKLAKFKAEEIEGLDEFADRQLNDTRYASSLAAGYIGILYGVRGDQRGVKRVQPTRGGVTAFLRMAWDMNSILGDGGLKQRNDHRHHAVDAIAVALTSPGTIKRLSDAAEHPRRDRRVFEDMPPPWPGFWQDARNAVAAIVVSHRPSRRVRGGLHDETNYGCPRPGPNGGQVVHYRMPLESLKAPAVAKIVDDKVREAVQAKLEELGGDLKKFKDPANHPRLPSGVPVHRVRIRTAVKTLPVGKDPTRYVAPGANSHLEIIEQQGAGEKAKWTWRLVSRFEALQRHRRKEPVVNRNVGEGERFLYTVSSKDMLEADAEGGSRRLLVVRAISEGEIECVEANDARTSKELRQRSPDDADKKTKRIRFSSAERLRQIGARKISVTPLGETRRAND